MGGHVGTHYPACWQTHPRCAAALGVTTTHPRCYAAPPRGGTRCMLPRGHDETLPTARSARR